MWVVERQGSKAVAATEGEIDPAREKSGEMEKRY